MMTATDTYLEMRAFCDELARCGMRHACTAPGSRSAPIVLSLAREPRIRTWSHIDERCAGFFALGAAKASGRPVAVACTSGTAAANLMPAVIEASQAGVPLVVLTADRPAELREVGAGQTIDQLKLYGGAVKWFFEVEIAGAGRDLRWIRTLACRAYWTSVEGWPGPVHLNFPLREPLVPDEELPPDGSGREGGAPWVTRPDPAPLAPTELPAGRGVIVAGAGSPDELPELAASAQLPLLADPLSGARRGPAAIAHYDLVLRDPTFAAEQAPRFVLRFGDLPTSKPLRTWLASLDATQLAIGTQLRWQDPDSVVAVHAATVRSEGGPEPDWLEAWRTAEARAAAAIVQALDQDGLSEPLVALRLGQWLPSEATLFVASSMPVRDVEAFFPVLDDPPRVLSNRGANGIDGTVSSAFGAAAAGERPVVLLIGDVALAHDVGGLLAAHRLELPITIVLLNNDGGGIFHFLAVANETDVFEDHVATPTGLDFSEAASLYGCEYRRPATVRELEAALHEGLGSRLTTIIEVRTDRRDNLALHRRLSEAVVDALSPPAAAELPPA